MGELGEEEEGLYLQLETRERMQTNEAKGGGGGGLHGSFTIGKLWLKRTTLVADTLRSSSSSSSSSLVRSPPLFDHIVLYIVYWNQICCAIVLTARRKPLALQLTVAVLGEAMPPGEWHRRQDTGG